jgi:hypothetical protein
LGKGLIWSSYLSSIETDMLTMLLNIGIAMDDTFASFVRIRAMKIVIETAISVEMFLRALV